MMKFKISVIGTALLALCCFFSQFIYSSPVYAKEPKVLMVVNKKNVEEVKHLLPPTLYTRVKEWGLSFNVVPTVSDFVPIKEYLDATKKYEGQCKVGSDGGLLNYMAGCPFPNPKTAQEIVWNFHETYTGDDRYYPMFTGYIVDNKGHVRTNKSHTSKLKYIGRVKLPPLPEIPNKEGIEFKDMTMQHFPNVVKGLGVLTIRYKASDREDDMWIYLPAMRRIRRMSTAQRGDTFGGSDTTWDDYHQYSGKIERNTYKMVGKQEILHLMHAEEGKLPDMQGIFCQGGNYEKVPVYVIESTSKDPNYVYSKRRWYVNPMTWNILYQDIYDRQGRLWKSISERMVINGDYFYNNCFEVIDYQTKHATFWCCPGYQKDLNQPQSDYTIKALKAFAR